MDINRPPESAAELAGLPPKGSTGWDAHVRDHADSFRPETLVCLMREIAASGNTALFERCALALAGYSGPDGRWVAGHCEGLIRAMARKFGFSSDPATLADFRQQCLIGMMLAILEGTEKKHFWEERFGRALKQLCIDEARKLVRQLESFEWADGRAEVDTDDTAGDGDPSFVHSEVWGRIVEEDFCRAIRGLPPRQAMAAFYTWIERRPIATADPGSVKNLMRISTQAVYALLRKAAAALAADPVIRKYLENR